MIRQDLFELLSIDVKYEDKKLYIWGTGNTSSLYQEGLKRLEKDCIIISGYVDNNKDKWGSDFFGKKVLSPEEVSKIDNVLILIASPQPSVINKVSEQIRSMGIEFLHIDSFVLSIYKNEVLKCFDLLYDQRSKDIYYELIRCRINGCYPDESYIDNNQYFSFEDFGDFNSNEVFVDCGAYVGDSIERYIWSKDGAFKKIIAFEPDRDNVKAMNCRVERLKNEWNFSNDKFEIYPYGISNKNSVSFVQRYNINNGFGSKIVMNDTDDSEEVVCVSIDDFIKEKIDFLKADIESYEYNLIIGAKNTIAKYQPKLAICIYHNIVDFYSIPILLNDINNNYKLSIRHYTHSLSDTVLYARV